MKVRSFKHKWRIRNQRETERQKWRNRVSGKRRLVKVLQFIHRTGFAQVSRMEIGNSFKSVNFGGGNPTSLVIRIFVSQPVY